MLPGVVQLSWALSSLSWISLMKATNLLQQSWIDDNPWWKTTFDGRQPLMKDNFWWKMTLKMEDDLWWKTTFDERWPLVEDDHLMEVNHWWKTTLDGRQPWKENNLWWKTTFDWRQLWYDMDGLSPLGKLYLFYKISKQFRINVYILAARKYRFQCAAVEHMRHENRSQ